jgi:hypothetical protein
MSDFDERLTAVLAAGSDDAPHPAGLAAAARRRHVRRRRTRVAAGGGAAAAALVGVVLVAGGAGEGHGDRMVADNPTTTPPASGWQTVVHDDVSVDLPGDWQSFTCDFDGFTSEIYGPTRDDACGFGTYVAFYASATFDPADLPGVITTGRGPENGTWGGYVYAGQYAVSASTIDADLTRHLLATARLASEHPIDVTEWWSLHEVGIRAEIPAYWGLGPGADLTDLRVCAAPGERNHEPELDPEPGTTSYAGLAYDDGRWISVSAPTQALADLVVATAESAPAHRHESGCISHLPSG